MAEGDTDELGWQMIPYVRETYQYLRDKEMEMPQYLARSPQMHRRRDLILWIATVCEQEDLTLEATHLAYYLLDSFMDNHDINDDQLLLLSIACITLATKHNDKEVKVPSLEKLNSYAKAGYCKADLLSMEILVLKYMNWNLYWPTAGSFAELFEREHNKTLCPVTNGNSASKRLADDMKMLSRKYIRFFLWCTAKDTFYYQYRPSQVAMACIVATRYHLMGMAEMYTLDLEKATGLTPPELNDCVQQLIKVNRTNGYSNMRNRSSEDGH